MNIEEKAKDFLEKKKAYGNVIISMNDGSFSFRSVEYFMAQFAEKMMHDLVDRYEEKIQSKVPELRKLVN